MMEKRTVRGARKGAFFMPAQSLARFGRLCIAHYRSLCEEKLQRSTRDRAALYCARGHSSDHAKLLCLCRPIRHAHSSGLVLCDAASAANQPASLSGLHPAPSRALLWHHSPRQAVVFFPGDIVDLLDARFGWRGRYIVMEKKTDTPLVKIKNLGTNSQQFVSAERLRRSKLPQFFIKGLHLS